MRWRRVAVGGRLSRLAGLCAMAVLAAGVAAAAERVIVLRGSRCPPGGEAVSAAEAIGLGGAACILLDPAARARLGVPGSPSASAQACGERAAEIAGLGDVLCGHTPVEASPAPTRDVQRPTVGAGRLDPGYEAGVGRLMLVLGSVAMVGRAALLVRILYNRILGHRAGPKPASPARRWLRASILIYGAFCVAVLIYALPAILAPPRAGCTGRSCAGSARGGP